MASLADMRVLVVDDDEGIRVMISRLFASEGMEVVAVGDGDVAVTALDTWDFDLVVLDLMLPTLSGYDVLKVIRENAMTALLPVVVMSAWAPLDIIKGADAVLSKPFRLHDFWRVVTSLVASRAYPRPDHRH